MWFFDDIGVEDKRMDAADVAKDSKESKSSLRHLEGADVESLEIIQYAMKLFPQSTLGVGVGVMTGVDPAAETGSIRHFIDIEGLTETAIKENSAGYATLHCMALHCTTLQTMRWWRR